MHTLNLYMPFSTHTLLSPTFGSPLSTDLIPICELFYALCSCLRISSTPLPVAAYSQPFHLSAGGEKTHIKFKKKKLLLANVSRTNSRSPHPGLGYLNFVVIFCFADPRETCVINRTFHVIVTGYLVSFYSNLCASAVIAEFIRK